MRYAILIIYKKIEKMKKRKLTATYEMDFFRLEAYSDGSIKITGIKGHSKITFIPYSENLATKKNEGTRTKRKNIPVTIQDIEEMIKDIFAGVDARYHKGKIKFSARQLAEHLNLWDGKSGKYSARQISLLLNDWGMKSSNSNRYKSFSILDYTTYEITELNLKGRYYTYLIQDYLSKDEIKSLFAQDEIALFKGISQD